MVLGLCSECFSEFVAVQTAKSWDRRNSSVLTSCNRSSAALLLGSIVLSLIDRSFIRSMPFLQKLDCCAPAPVQQLHQMLAGSHLTFAVQAGDFKLLAIDQDFWGILILRD